MSWREYSLSVSVFGFRGCLPVLFAPFANVAASSFPGNLIWSQLQQGPAGGQCLPRSPLEKKLLRFGSWSGALFQKGLSMHDKVTSGRLRGSSSLISTSGKAPVSLKLSPNIHTDSRGTTSLSWVRHRSLPGPPGVPTQGLTSSSP